MQFALNSPAHTNMDQGTPERCHVLAARPRSQHSVSILVQAEEQVGKDTSNIDVERTVEYDSATSDESTAIQIDGEKVVI